MATGKPTHVPWPLSSFPGAVSQESAGRLINCSAEPLGEGQNPSGPAPQVWRRQPGLSLHAVTANTGYRGGLLVGNSAYEVWTGNGNVATVDANGVVTGIAGNLLGTKKVSIARNQRTGANSPDVVAVDIDNGAFSLNTGGALAAYNGGGNLPQPKAVCFQDGYFFFLLGNCQIYASGINALTQNALTFTTMQAKSSVVGQRIIAYSGLLWGFTTAHCEIYQDVANVAPNFPYARLAVLEYGLVQENAIAGWEDGFSMLTWVAQDFGVYQVGPQSQQPQKISPPDLDKLIEAQIRAGNLIEAGCYAFGGKKFWHLSSPAWSWEFNLSTNKWNERWSINTTTGNYGRWRATCGHPAFGKWLVGDQFSGNMLWIDSTNFMENGWPQLFRMESGPVRDFPDQIRIARADFDFDMGQGLSVGNVTMTVTGAASGTGGFVRLTVVQVPRTVATNDQVNVSGVGGTTEANGSFPCTVIDGTHIELQGTVFVHAYTSGGTVVDVTAPANAINPTAAIYCSKDGGLSWGNPLFRSLGPQGKIKRTRASVKNQGISSAVGDRWRVDVTDQVYVGFLGSTQSSDPREVGA